LLQLLLLRIAGARRPYEMVVPPFEPEEDLEANARPQFRRGLADELAGLAPRVVDAVDACVDIDQ